MTHLNEMNRVTQMVYMASSDEQMELGDEETMTIEEAREMTLAAVRKEYAKL